MRRGKPSREYDHLFSSPYVSKAVLHSLGTFWPINSVKCEINSVKRSSDSVTSNGFKKCSLCGSVVFLQMFWKPYFFSPCLNKPWKHRRPFRNFFNVADHNSMHVKELNVFLSDSGYENGNYQRPSNKQCISNADVLFSLDSFNS